MTQKKQKTAADQKAAAVKKALDFFKGKKPCWEIRGCVGKPGGAPECPAYSNRQRPCWEWQDTICKGASGKDVSVCKICEVYLQYGHGVRIGVPKKVPVNQ